MIFKCRFNFIRNSKLFSTVTVPFCHSTNNTWTFQLLHTVSSSVHCKIWELNSFLSPPPLPSLLTPSNSCSLSYLFLVRQLLKSFYLHFFDYLQWTFVSYLHVLHTCSSRYVTPNLSFVLFGLKRAENFF